MNAMPVTIRVLKVTRRLRATADDQGCDGAECRGERER
jgi:hypothetical protein